MTYKDRFESLWPETGRGPAKAKRLFPPCLSCRKELTLQHVNEGFRFCNVECRNKYPVDNGESSQ